MHGSLAPSARRTANARARPNATAPPGAARGDSTDSADHAGRGLPDSAHRAARRRRGAPPTWLHWCSAAGARSPPWSPPITNYGKYISQACRPTYYAPPMSSPPAGGLNRVQLESSVHWFRRRNPEPCPNRRAMRRAITCICRGGLQQQRQAPPRVWPLAATPGALRAGPTDTTARQFTSERTASSSNVGSGHWVMLQLSDSALPTGGCVLAPARGEIKLL